MPSKPNTPSQHALGTIIELYLSIFILSFTGLFAKLIDWHPVPIIFWRSVIAGLTLFVVLRFQKKSLYLDSKRDFKVIILLGILMVTHWVSFYWAIQLSTVAMGMVALYTYPVITSMLEPILHDEPFDPLDLVAALGVFVGIIVMNPIISLQNQAFLGCLVGVGSATILSFRNILSRRYVKQYSGEVVMMYQLLGAVILLPFLGFIDHDWSTNIAMHLLLLGTIGTAAAHTLWTRSLAHFKASTTGILSCLAPVFGAVMAMLLLDEALPIRTLLGGSIILIIALLETRRQVPRRPS